jgi:hypothetical protein
VVTKAGLIVVVVFNATFNNISVISWQSILLVKETIVQGENHRPASQVTDKLYHIRPPLLSNIANNLYYVTLILIAFHSVFYIYLTCIKRPPVLCDHISLFPWKVT